MAKEELQTLPLNLTYQSLKELLVMCKFAFCIIRGFVENKILLRTDFICRQLVNPNHL